MVKFTGKKIKWSVKQIINKEESTVVVVAIYGHPQEEYRN
jgi:hypothetical protein